jgi:phosphotransferase system enzyme I (PtsP)
MSDAKNAFEVIRSVTRTMMESSGTRPALDAVVRLISEKMGADVCAIYLHDPATDTLKMASACGLNTTAALDVRLKSGEGLTGAVFSKGEVINIANPRSDSRFIFFPKLGEDRLNNFLGVPIPPGNAKGLGVLTLQGIQAEPFNETVRDLAYTLAAQVGTLLETRALKDMPPPVEPASLAPISAVPREAPPFIRPQVAFGGIADGVALVLKTHQVWENLLFSECADPDAELTTFRKALNLARQETRELRRRAGELFAEMDARIFDTHELFLLDEEYTKLIENHIREKMTAAFAVKLATREVSKSFVESGNAKLAERAADLRDVALRLLNALGEAEEHYHPEAQSDQGIVVAATELLPSDLIYLQSRKLIGILCETGGLTSHAAILARSLDIPCFIGIPGLTQFLHSGTRVILDGNSGIVYIKPDAPVIREYQRLLEAFKTRRETSPREDRTADGHPVQLSGNVSLLSDLQLMKRFGIKSVGLYRSEFFFMIRSTFPNEEDQFGVYRQVMERCGVFGVTFRLLDVGGDKPLKYFDWGKEENPSLGWRSVRMLLERPDILKPHMRALLRASQLGQMRLVLPMISTLTEVRTLKEHLREAAAELEKEHGREFPVPPIGIMIEIPSTVLQIDGFLYESDFLCLGTNDLIQYLFAIDRGNERVTSYHQPYHPALLQSLKIVADAAHKAGKPVTVCGEMAGDPKAVALLLGMGLTSLSISPGSAEGIREAFARIKLRDCERLVRKVLQLSTAEEVRKEVEAFWPESADSNT